MKNNLMKLATISIVTIMAASLAACGGTKENSQPAEIPEVDSAQETAPAEAPISIDETEVAESEDLSVEAEGMPVTEGMSSEELVGIIKEKYMTAVDDKWSDDDLQRNDMSTLVKYIDSVENIGFSNDYDLDYDGNKDVLITDLNDESGMILAAYSTADSAITPLFISEERSAYYIIAFTEDLTSLGILNKTSSSASQSAYIQCNFMDGGLSFLDAIIYDDTKDADHPWYKSYDKDMNLDNAEVITEDDANDQMESLDNSIVKVDAAPITK